MYAVDCFSVGNKVTTTTCPWGLAVKFYCWSCGSDSSFRQPHPPEACCNWNFGARQVLECSSEDHTSSRPCFVQDGPTGSLHMGSGLDGADEEFVWHEGWTETPQQLALVPWLPCLNTHKESPVDCQPPPCSLGVGTEMAEPDNGPLAACHLRWQVQFPNLPGRWQA